MGNCGGRPGGNAAHQSGSVASAASVNSTSRPRANSPEEAVEAANFQSIQSTDDETAAAAAAAASGTAPAASGGAPSSPKPISRQATAIGRSSMRKTTSRQITNINTMNHNNNNTAGSSGPPTLSQQPDDHNTLNEQQQQQSTSPTQLVRVRSIQKVSPRMHARHASSERPHVGLPHSSSGAAATSDGATTGTPLSSSSPQNEVNMTNSPRNKQRTVGSSGHQNHLNSSAGGAPGTGSHRTKRRLVRRTSHKGMLSALALKFPMIRASFVAVHRVFEQYHRQRMEANGNNNNNNATTTAAKPAATATLIEQSQSSSSATRRNTEFDKQAITQDKLKDVLQAIASHKQFTDEEIRQLFALSDLDGSATISFREFLIVVACGYFLKVDPALDAEAAADTSFMSIRKGFKAIEDAFREMDEDKSGTVDASELKRALFESTPAPLHAQAQPAQAAGSISPVLTQHSLGSPTNAESTTNNATSAAVAAAAARQRKRNSLDAAPRRASTQTNTASLGGGGASGGTGTGASATTDGTPGGANSANPQLHRRTRSQSLATAQQTAETNHAQLMAKRFAELDFNEDGSVELGEFIFGIVSWVSFMDEDDD